MVPSDAGASPDDRNLGRPGRTRADGGGLAAPPDWLVAVGERIQREPPEYFRSYPVPPGTHRRSAVLMLFGASPEGGEDVLLTERAHDMRAHPAQVSFPGGQIDPSDAGPQAAALREAHEEVDVEADSVAIVAELPELYLGPSANGVTPVLAWWRRPHEVHVKQPVEVARVVRAPLSELLDPANRFVTQVPVSGAPLTPGFLVQGLFIWGFTGMLLSTLFDEAGLTRPWDRGQCRDLPDHMLEPYRQRGILHD